jgi:pimeloyl-ACP methyl ester carboxylesterase
LDRNAWRPAPAVAPIGSAADLESAGDIALAEWHFAQAHAAEKNGQADCVDHYYQAAALAWPALRGTPPSAPSQRAWDLYHSAVAEMLSAAQRHGRWDPRSGLLVQGAGGLTPVPAIYNGFAWEPSDFQELAPVGSYEVPQMNRQIRSAGLGVPLVAVRRAPPGKPFLKDVQSFAATAVLRPPSREAASLSLGDCQTPGSVLEFINPLNTGELPGPAGDERLARDLSAPFAYPPREEDRAWLTDFLIPGSTTRADGLFMLEPYQRGKIPVVFVHGLLSDPLTWTSMVNELRADRELNERYQIWGFRYSTGAQFFQSAAILRRQLDEIRRAYDPQRCDPAMSQMVLVGHSMGGLLVKLQVVYSGDELWRTLANRPPSAIVTTPEVRGRLTDQFFFDPNPDIARVVFIGTPHQGSETAGRCIGRIGAALVESPPDVNRQHAQLLRDNPGVFNPEVERRIPRSIDLLEPENPFLRATLRLPFRAGVRVHSICGVIDRVISAEPSDGVVPLTSARLAGACSEKLAPAKHMDLNKDPSVITEVARILHLHVR